MKIKIDNATIEVWSGAYPYLFPKYTTQIINLLNSNAQGTRPAVVGQLSDLIQEFPGKTLDDWVLWYAKQKPGAVDAATDRIFNMYQQMSKAFASINREMIEAWVKDLVYNKTFCGLKFQSAIIKFLADKYKVRWRLANKKEESKGIDGFVGNVPIQIKPSSYKQEFRLLEDFEVSIVYYEKRKDGIFLEFDPHIFEFNKKR